LATGDTFANGINDAGQIVGYYITGGHAHGFLLSGGTYITLDDPLGAQGTILEGINDMGQIVGTYIDSGFNRHGFLLTITPNTPPPGGTSADMILRHGADGQYEIYDIGNNAILAGYSLGQDGTDWGFVTLGGFNGSDTTDMLLRSSTTGGFEVYDIANNNINRRRLPRQRWHGLASHGLRQFLKPRRKRHDNAQFEYRRGRGLRCCE